MEKLQKQMFLKKMFFSSAVCISLTLFFWFAFEPLYLLRYRMQLRTAYDVICEYNDRRLDSLSSTEELEDISSTVNFLVTDGGFRLLYGSDPISEQRNILGRIRSAADSFRTDAQPVLYENITGRPYAIRARIGTEPQYYLYIYRNTAVLHRRALLIRQLLVVIFPLLLILEGFVFYALVGKMLHPAGQIKKELEALEGGNYALRLTETMPDNEYAELSSTVNSLADTLMRYDGSLKNYKYMISNRLREGTELSSMQKKLVSNITHQLKTPLAIISSQVELAHTETDSLKRDYYYESILDEIDKMSMLITNILQEAREAREFMPVHRRRIRLSELLEEQVPRYENWIQAKGVRFEAKIEKDISAYADPVQVEQAVNNYLMNAYRFTRPGRRIILSLDAEADGCRITVYNEGDGIPEGELDSIWRDFYQIESGQTNDRVGLGLYIVADIMRQHGGSCGVKNVDGGVMFWLFFPDREE